MLYKDTRHRIQGYLVASDIKICIIICILVHMLLNDIHAKKFTWIHTSLICDHLCPSPSPQHSILHLLCSMPSLSFSTLDIPIPFICIDWIDLHQHTLPLQLLHCKHWLLISPPSFISIYLFFIINFSAQTIYLCVDVGDVWSYVCIRVDEEK